MRYFFIFYFFLSLPFAAATEDFYSPAFPGTLPSPKVRGETYPLKSIKDTTVFPFRAIGRIGTGCTGTLIGPKHVLTAAHCVYSMDDDYFYRELEFTPGINGKLTPFETASWETVYAPDEWTESHDEDYDFAVIVLDEPIGKKLGWLGYAIPEEKVIESLKITGYPGEKPSKTLWGSTCSPFDFSKKWIHYLCETQGGMSGSGVLNMNDDRVNTLIAIHALGGPKYNSGVRITKSVYKMIQKWVE